MTGTGRNLALVGVGQWGRNFLRTITTTGRDKLIWIVSSKTLDELRAIAPVEAKLASSVDQFTAQNPEIDGVIVATPPQGRFAIVKQLLSSGFPVLAEKPLTLNLAETTELVSLARDGDLPLVEDFIHLYSWPYLTIMQEMDDDSWPVQITSEGCGHGPFRDYSVVMDYAPHDLAMALQVFGCEPQSMRIELVDFRDPLSYTARITLDFGDRGEARITASNIHAEKTRKLTLVQSGQCWVYDDRAKEKLVLNDGVVESRYSGMSPLELLLEQFSGRQRFYGQARLYWLSESVARLLEQLEAQSQQLIASKTGKNPVV